MSDGRRQPTSSRTGSGKSGSASSLSRCLSTVHRTVRRPGGSEPGETQALADIGVSGLHAAAHQGGFMPESSAPGLRKKSIQHG